MRRFSLVFSYMAVAVLSLSLVMGGLRPLAVAEGAAGFEGYVLSGQELPSQRVGEIGGFGIGGDRVNRDVPGSYRSQFPVLEYPGTGQEQLIEVKGVPSRGLVSEVKPDLLREDERRRDRFGRTFVQSDGSLATVVSSEPLNFKDADGKWQSVVPELESAGDGWVSTGDEVKTVLPQKLDAGLGPRLVLGAGLSVGWRLLGASSVEGKKRTVESLVKTNAVGEKVPAAGEVVYGTDRGFEVVLRPIAGGVKETIVLSSASSPRVFDFGLDLQGLSAEVSGAEVVLKAGDGQVRGVIPAGFMAEASGEAGKPGRVSSGVGYSLVAGADGKQVLRVSLDSSWLDQEGLRFPVSVDPSVKQVNASLSTNFTSEGTTAGDQEMKIGKREGVSSAGYLQFGGLEALANHHVMDARLVVVDYNAASCTPRQVSVHKVTSPWAGISRFPGPGFDPNPLGAVDTAHGYVDYNTGKTACPGDGTSINLGATGAELVQGWLDGSIPNYGLSVRAPDDEDSWKSIAGYGTANPPALILRHSPYRAEYSFMSKGFDPIVMQSQDGKIKIRVKNASAVDWNPGDFYLAYTIFNAEDKPVAQQRAADLQGVVKRGESVDLNAVVKQAPIGRYLLDFTMIGGGKSFIEEGTPPARVQMQVFNAPPVIKQMHPSNGYQSPTLSPQLWAIAVDLDAPNRDLEYKFTVEEMTEGFDSVVASTFSSDFSSGYSWRPPHGKLVWSKNYRWFVESRDKNGGLTKSPVSSFSTTIPQPFVAAGVAAGQGLPFDPSSGAFALSATDVSLSAAGSKLEIERKYQSMDARRGVFGIGWSSLLDMKVQEDKSTGIAMVTLADGSVVAFGRNADGSFSAPMGNKSILKSEDSGYTLRVFGGTTFRFSAFKLEWVDVPGKRRMFLSTQPDGSQELRFSEIDRILKIFYKDGLVEKVTGPDLDGKTPTWTYTYENEKLVKACAPMEACRSYEYTKASLYAPTVLASSPIEYWRMSEEKGPVLATANEKSLGVTNANAVSDVEFNQAGVNPGGGGTSAKTVAQSGKTGRIDLPKGILRQQRELAVEMWFKVDGVGFVTPLLGYQDAEFGSKSKKGIPILFVDGDGILKGQFAASKIEPINSKRKVTNGEWHHVVLSSWGTSQNLYLDGKEVGKLDTPADHEEMVYAQLGAATSTQDLPGFGSGTKHGTVWFDEVAVYDRQLTARAIDQHYQAGKTPSYQLTKATTPAGNTHMRLAYDPVSSRVKEYVDSNDGKWRAGVPVTFGSKTDLRRSVMVYDPANSPYMFEYDAITNRLLRQGFPTGAAAKIDPIPDPKDNAPKKSQCTKYLDDNQYFCAVNIGDKINDLQLVTVNIQSLSVRSFHYDAQGRQTKVVNENGASATMGYDKRGNVTAQTTCADRFKPESCATRRSKYAQSFTDPLDPRWDKLIETRNGLASGPDDPSHVETTAYDGLGRVVQSMTVDKKISLISYGQSGGEALLPVVTTDFRGQKTRMEYSSQGDLTKVVSPAGVTSSFTHDVWGRVLTHTVQGKSDSKVVTSYSYDLTGRLIAELGPESKNAVTGARSQMRTSIEYDRNSQVTKTTIQDVLSSDKPRTTITDFDQAGRPKRKVDPAGGESFINYDIMGNPATITDAEGRKQEFKYTARNKVGERKVRLDDKRTLVTTNNYDLAGRLVFTYDPMGRRTEYRYNDDDTLAGVYLDKLIVDGRELKDVPLQTKTYNKAGHVVKEQGLNGTNTIAYIYDAFERIIAVVKDPGGASRTVQTRYNVYGDVVATRQSGQPIGSLPVGSMTTVDPWAEYTYDDFGRRTRTVFDVGGTDKTTLTNFDEFGRAISVVAPGGFLPGASQEDFTTRFEFDNVGRQTKVIAPPRTVEMFGVKPEKVSLETVTGYDGYGNVTSVKSALGLTTRTEFDVLNRPVKVEQPGYAPVGGNQVASTSTVSYDKTGQVMKSVDVLGQETTYSYDVAGRLTSTTAPASGKDGKATWRYEYTAMGLQSAVIDPLGARSESTYDELNRKITSTRIERTPNQVNLVTKTVYDDRGNVKAITNPKGETTKFGYASSGEAISVTDPRGTKREYGFDGFGRPLQTMLPTGHSQVNAYDLVGNKSGVYDYSPEGHIIRRSTFQYDINGHLTKVIDPLGKSTEYSYNNVGLKISQTEHADANTAITSSFGYDVYGRQTRYTDGNQNDFWTTFNALGLPESTIEPSTAAHPDAKDRTWTTTYDAGGRPTSVQAPGGVTRTRMFDAGGRLVKEEGSGTGIEAAVREFGYDALGHLITLRSPRGEDTFQYNDADQLVKASGPSGDSQFSYDEAGQLMARQTPAGDQKFTYDKGFLSGIHDGLSGMGMAYHYDLFGRISTIDFGAGRTRTVTYDGMNRLASDSLTNALKKTVSKLEYGYDAVNNVTAKKTFRDDAVIDETFTYDDAYRLKTWTANGVTTDYQYDPNGNRIQAGTLAASFDERNRLLKSGDTEFSYTPRGTVREKKTPHETTTLWFDAFDRLVSDGKSTTTYDSLNRIDTTEGKQASYAGLAKDPSKVGEIAYSRTATGGLLASGNQSFQRVMITDRHDDVVAGFDPKDGQLSRIGDSRRYDPWGVPQPNTSPRLAETGVGFQSNWTATGTGLVNMQARWYDPATGAFLSRDTAPDNGTAVKNNRHTYANANPVTLNDPDGHMAGLPSSGCGIIKRFLGLCPGKPALFQFPPRPVPVPVPEPEFRPIPAPVAVWAEGAGRLSRPVRFDGPTQRGGPDPRQAIYDAAVLANATAAATVVSGIYPLTASDIAGSGTGSGRGPAAVTSVLRDTVSDSASWVQSFIAENTPSVDSVVGGMGAAIQPPPPSPETSVVGKPACGRSGGGLGVGTPGSLASLAFGPLVLRGDDGCIPDIAGELSEFLDDLGDTFVDMVFGDIDWNFRWKDFGFGVGGWFADLADLGMLGSPVGGVLFSMGVPLPSQAYEDWVRANGGNPDSIGYLAGGLAPDIALTIATAGGGTAAKTATKAAIHNGGRGARAGERVLFGQKRISPTFSGEGSFQGRSIADVAEDLRRGVLSPDDIEIKAFRYADHLVSVNNRSLAALSEAGYHPSNVRVVSPTRDELRRLREIPVLGGSLPADEIAVTVGRRLLRIIKLPG